MADPYVYEGTTILKNIPNIRDQAKLDEYESTMVQLSLTRLYKEGINVSRAHHLFDIHKALFLNIFEWAGQKRIINIYKQEQVLAGLSVEYSKFDNIEKDLSSIDANIIKTNWEYLSTKRKIKLISKIIASIWQVHPFREGNTRSVATFLYFFMKGKGLTIDADFLSKHAKFFRNALVLASIGKYSEFNHLESILTDSVDNESVSVNDKKYSEINGYNLDNYKYNYHLVKDG